jgi:hypothetical protein
MMFSAQQAVTLVAKAGKSTVGLQKVSLPFSSEPKCQEATPKKRKTGNGAVSMDITLISDDEDQIAGGPSTSGLPRKERRFGRILSAGIKFVLPFLSIGADSKNPKIVVF